MVAAENGDSDARVWREGVGDRGTIDGGDLEAHTEPPKGRLRGG